MFCWHKWTKWVDKGTFKEVPSRLDVWVFAVDPEKVFREGIGHRLYIRQEQRCTKCYMLRSRRVNL